MLRDQRFPGDHHALRRGVPVGKILCVERSGEAPGSLGVTHFRHSKPLLAQGFPMLGVKRETEDIREQL